VSVVSRQFSRDIYLLSIPVTLRRNRPRPVTVVTPPVLTSTASSEACCIPSSLPSVQGYVRTTSRCVFSFAKEVPSTFGKRHIRSWVKGSELTESGLSVTPLRRVFISQKYIQSQYGDRQTAIRRNNKPLSEVERPLQKTACGARVSISPCAMAVSSGPVRAFTIRSCWRWK